MVNAGAGAVPAMPVILLDRLTRTLQGAAGEGVELPLLRLRLLETLAAAPCAAHGLWPRSRLSVHRRSGSASPLPLAAAWEATCSTASPERPIG